MFVPFKSYEDIPPLTKEYVVYVADTKSIEEVSLDDINGLVLMLSEDEVQEEGWVQ